MIALSIDIHPKSSYRCNKILNGVVVQKWGPSAANVLNQLFKDLFGVLGVEWQTRHVPLTERQCVLVTCHRTAYSGPTNLLFGLLDPKNSKNLIN